MWFKNYTSKTHERYTSTEIEIEISLTVYHRLFYVIYSVHVCRVQMT